MRLSTPISISTYRYIYVSIHLYMLMCISVSPYLCISTYLHISTRALYAFFYMSMSPYLRISLSIPISYNSRFEMWAFLYEVYTSQTQRLRFLRLLRSAPCHVQAVAFLESSRCARGHARFACGAPAGVTRCHNPGLAKLTLLKMRCGARQFDIKQVQIQSCSVVWGQM